MLVCLCTAVVIALVWLITAFCKNYSRGVVQGESQQQNYRSRAEPFMNNFMIRFLYEIFFELAICAMINFSDQKAGGVAQWMISLATLITLGGALLTIMSLFCRNGPYIKDTFA